MLIISSLYYTKYYPELNIDNHYSLTRYEINMTIYWWFDETYQKTQLKKI